MKKNLRYLLLATHMILCSMGCSQIDKKSMTLIENEFKKVLVTTQKHEHLKTLLDQELAYVSKIEDQDLKNEIIDLIQIPSYIHYSESNCTNMQISCSNGSEIGTIFINLNFFETTPVEQFSSLLHEAKHLKDQKFEHSKCTKKPEWGNECDEDLDSSYGIEYKYQLYRYLESKDDSLTQLLLRSHNRINSL